MPQAPLNEWTEFIRQRPNAHILQTAEWGELKAAFGWEAIRVVCGDVGVQLLFRRLAFGLTVGYIPKPITDITTADGVQALWEELAAICHQRRAVLLKVEPDAWISHETEPEKGAPPRRFAGMTARRSEHNIQPPRTIVVDLHGSEDDVLGRMKQKCRYNIRLAEKKGVIVRPWAELELFHGMMQLTGARDGFGVHASAYYRRAYELFRAAGECELLVAEHEGVPLAALMVFRRGARAWYLYGASRDSERNRMPTYLLQWEAMRWAKARGSVEYDLWGAPDESEHSLEANFASRQDGLWGVYRFKRGFGGEVKRAAHAVDLVFNPVLHALYRWRMAGREAG